MKRTEHTPPENALTTVTSLLASLVLIVSVWRARGTVASADPERPFVPAAPDNVIGRVDAAQRRVPGLSFLTAVFKKFGDDGGGRLAAHLTYSGFLSLFPLLLVLTTILGYILSGHPDLQERLLDSALVQFPIIGDQLRSNVGSLQGNALALAVGLVTAVWGGLGVTQAAQEILADIWMVPRRQRAGFLPRLGKAAAVLFVLGGGLIMTATVAALGAGLGLGWPGRLGIAVVSVAMDTVWFAIVFRLLLPVTVSWSETWPGSLLAAAGWQVLLTVGATLVDRQLRGATQSYGFFGVVLGLLAWLALLSTLLAVAAEVNAVRAHRLWPRSLVTAALTDEDRRALTATARVEERAPGERVDVTFGEPLGQAS